MDLHPYGLSDTQISAAASLLNYQPFRIDDRIVTGVGYSWLYETTDLARLNAPQLVFDRTRETPEVWHRAVAAYVALNRSYESFLDAIVRTCPAGSYLDLCCNSGYFPVRASLRGMSPCVGVEPGDFSPQIDFLNAVTGAGAGFERGVYRPFEHRFVLPFEGRRFDVVSNMAFMIHVPDPLHLLRSIAELSDHAVFLWSTFVRSDELIIRYPKPNQFNDLPFPWGYDAGTALSDTLLIDSMRRLDFPNHREIEPAEGGWPVAWDNPLMMPYQPLRAFMFTRT